ncbi:Major facilitator superfamily domain-containing protein 1 [Verticillium dahliae VDG2]|nr:Major facilitator superfamily domain-containing protein 1 [Verticillium dahliae VDG2]
MAGDLQDVKEIQSISTPEPPPEQQLSNGRANTPSTPGVFTSFDWEDFEARYHKALTDADGKEQELMNEFNELVKHELVAFHEAHFSHSAIGGFTSDFLNPQREASQIHNLDDAEPELQDDDDGLGYYDDGVKRTLTDEQIAMFRHSELEALRRKGEKLPVIVDQASGNEAEDGEVEDGGNATSNAKPTPTASSGAGKKKKKGKKSARSKPYEPKPDLRKRTWDIVETGLDTLEYD